MNKKNVLLIILGIFLGFGFYYFYSNYSIHKNSEFSNETSPSLNYSQNSNPKPENSNFTKENDNSLSISELTEENRVVSYVKQHGRLPDCYITKNEARRQGWNASDGNLCEALPGKAIGGDRFGNRERRLPYEKGRQYYEADLNYDCGNRGADRLIFSNDGLVFVTHDHYNSFKEK